ncbi:MAG TPA: hypothetical protein VJ829_15605 [Candidatus Binatia bacterium]|nr:hypothetical protein [Candidatus Binatia bacterium]
MRTHHETETRYRLATVDLARPLPAIALDGTETGVGLTIRLDGQPLGFVLRELPPGAVLEPAAVAELMGHSERVALLEERIRRELLPAREAPVARRRSGSARAPSSRRSCGSPPWSTTTVTAPRRSRRGSSRLHEGPVERVKQKFSLATVGARLADFLQAPGRVTCARESS